MPKRKEVKGTRITLKIARKAIRMTPDGHRRLTLSNMGITHFPKCLLKLTDFDALDLSRNLIRKLPLSFGKLSSLKWLDLHSNKLESVPESISNLVVLTHLNLSNNFLTFAGLPPTLGSLTNLKCLNLGMNKLDNLPSTMVALDSLQEFGLFDNLFRNLPDFLHVLKNLTKLNMKRNPLLCLQEDGKELLQKKSKPEVPRPCFKIYKEQQKKLTGGERRNMIGEKRIRTYAGLMVPNSVAALNQDTWRIRH